MARAEIERITLDKIKVFKTENGRLPEPMKIIEMEVQAIIEYLNELEESIGV